MCDSTIRSLQNARLGLLGRSRGKAFGQLGFSVLELMVALAVGAVLLTVAVPSFTTVARNAAMVSGANSFLADLHYARDLAVTRNQRVIVCASSNGTACNSSDWAQGWLIFVDLNNDGALNSGEPILRTSSGLPSLSVQPLVFTNAITYRPNGRAMAASVAQNFGAFVLCDDRGLPHARGIIVDVNGRPRVTRLAGSPTITCPA